MRLGFSVLGGGHKLSERLARLGSSPLVAVLLLVLGLGVVAGVLASCPLGLAAGAECPPPPRPVVAAKSAADDVAPSPPTVVPAAVRAEAPASPADLAPPAAPIMAVATTARPPSVSAQTPQPRRDPPARPTGMEHAGKLADDVAKARPAPGSGFLRGPVDPLAPDRTAPAPPAPAADAAARVVAGEGVNVRAGPAMSSEKLFALAGGARVTVTGSEQGWVRVVDGEGRGGWVYGKFLLVPPS